MYSYLLAAHWVESNWLNSAQLSNLEGDFNWWLKLFIPCIISDSLSLSSFLCLDYYESIDENEKEKQKKKKKVVDLVLSVRKKKLRKWGFVVFFYFIFLFFFFFVGNFLVGALSLDAEVLLCIIH